MKKAVFLAMVVAAACAFSRAVDAASFQVREYGGMPCMWHNGLPYFARFPQSSRGVQDLSGQWLFALDPDDAGEREGFFREDFDDRGWERTLVPGVWNAAGGGHPQYKGAAWHRLRFVAEGGAPGDFYRLYFDGVAFHGKVWLNGVFLGSHSGGYTGWSLDATQSIRPGKKNVIAVRVDNRRSYTDVPPKLWVNEKLGWWPYGGIARAAKIIRTPRVSVNKLVTKAEPAPRGGVLSVSGLVFNYGGEEARAVIKAELGSGLASLGPVRVAVPAGDCARFELGAVEVPGVKPWSPEEPWLYPLKVEVASDGTRDSVSHPAGFRRFEIRGTKLYLNGELFWMRGMNRHEDDPDTGLFQTEARMEQDMELLKELHVNHMRPAHYPNDPRWLDLCDSRGVTVIHEIPLYQAGSGIMKWVEAKIQKRRKNVPWTVGGREYQVLGQMKDPELYANAEQQLIEMIERDRNHPSVIMWSVGNENFTFLGSSREMLRRLVEVCKRFDDRPVTFALLSAPYGITPLLERTGDLPDVLMMNEYYGWYFGRAEKIGEFLDRVHRRWPDKPIIVSEFGAGAVQGRHSGAPPEKFSEEYQVYLYHTQYDEILEKPFVAGTMPWILADFRCPWFLEEHPVYQMNLKGLVSHQRVKKQAFEAVSEIYGRIEKEGGPEAYRE